MKYGLTETAVGKIRDVFVRFSVIEKAVLYGSRAKGNYKTGSDIDLTLYGEALTSDLLPAIASALDDLHLPYTFDLSVFDELSHSKLREHIERVGVVFYQRTDQGTALKKGWQRKEIGDLCEVIAGQSPEGKFYNSEGKGIPFYQGKKDFGEKFIEAPTIWTTQTTKVAREGDILMSVRAPVGPVNFATEEICIGRGLAAIRSGAKLNRDFLFYQLLHLQPDIAGKEGAVFASINKSEIEALPLVFPLLPEQQRIVGLLDEAFAGIATAQANAEKNLQNARALFESHLQSVFTQRGKGWVDKTFEALIESNVIGLTKSSREQGEDKAWPYVKMNNITRDNQFDFSSFTHVDATDEEVNKFSLRDGDFLFNTRNSYELVGKSCIYESDSNDVVLFNNNIMRVRFKSGVDARFVLLAFSSKAVADELNALKSGTTNVSAIYFKDLKSLVIPVPPIEVQKQIAAKLELLVAETQRLATLYERKLAALAALKKSLLHQAFTGEL